MKAFHGLLFIFILKHSQSLKRDLKSPTHSMYLEIILNYLIPIISVEYTNLIQNIFTMYNGMDILKGL